MRHLLRHRAGWLALLVGLALLLRVAVPAGFMPDRVAGTTLLRPCPDAGPMPAAMAMAPGDHHEGGHDAGGHAGKPAPPCAFGGLAAPALGGADIVLLAGLVLFVLARARLPAAAPRPGAAAHRRPPVRGPPVPTR